MRVAQLSATVLVTWFVVTRAGLTLSELQAFDVSVWHPRWALLAASCVVLLLGYGATGYLWGVVVHGLGGPSLPPAVRVRLFMIANLGRYVPGKVWQIAGLAVLARQYGVAGSTATAAAILGQGIALAAATLIGIGGVWTVADGATWRWAVPALLFGATAIGLSPTVFRAVTRSWFRLAKTPAPPDLAVSAAVGWLVLGLASWLIYAVAFWLFVLGLGLSAPLMSTASAFAAAYVVGYVVVFAPAGLGVRESALVVLLAPQFGASGAGAVAVAARLWTTVIEVIPAAAFWARHLTSDRESPSTGVESREPTEEQAQSRE
jgi:glycosyltransferase 2 family protein